MYSLKTNIKMDYKPVKLHTYMYGNYTQHSNHERRYNMKKETFFACYTCESTVHSNFRCTQNRKKKKKYRSFCCIFKVTIWFSYSVLSWLDMELTLTLFLFVQHKNNKYLFGLELSSLLIYIS